MSDYREYKVELVFKGLPNTDFLTELLELLRKHQQTSLNTINLQKILLIEVHKNE